MRYRVGLSTAKVNLKDRIKSRHLLLGHRVTEHFCSAGDGASFDTGLVIGGQRAHARRSGERIDQPSEQSVRPSMKQSVRKCMVPKRKVTCKNKKQALHDKKNSINRVFIGLLICEGYSQRDALDAINIERADRLKSRGCGSGQRAAEGIAQPSQSVGRGLGGPSE